MHDPAYVRRAYDVVAAEYAEQFAGELAHKPFDRALLERFARAAPAAPILDLGCDPGQTTAVLRTAGAAAHALDLSPALLREAGRRQPGLPAAADMLALPVADAAVAGIVAFYAIVHFESPALGRALAEMRRVLRPGGRLLLAFHVGDTVTRVEDFSRPGGHAGLVFHSPAAVAQALHELGVGEVDTTEREPYAGVEYPSRLGGELFHFEEPNEHIRLRLGVSLLEARAWVASLQRLAEMRVPAG